jgi:hypothetical protein
MASGSSYNGWPANSDKNAIGIVPFGDLVGLPFPGGIKSGDVATVMAYVASQFHYRVEAVIEGWDWGYTFKANANNPNQLSCHASGTAIDINAPLHPNGSSGTFTNAQEGEIYAILDEVQGAVDWLHGYDEMHFEICVGASTLANIAATLPAPGPVPPEPEPTPEPLPIQEDDDMLQLLKIAGGDGKIYAASVGGRRFYYIGNPDSLSANQKAGTYSPDIIEVDSGQLNHVRYACQIQLDDDPAAAIP